MTHNTSTYILDSPIRGLFSNLVIFWVKNPMFGCAGLFGRTNLSTMPVISPPPWLKARLSANEKCLNFKPLPYILTEHCPLLALEEGFSYLQLSVCRSWRKKRRMSNKHLIHYYSNRPPITKVCVTTPLQHLWCNVVGCAH